MSETIQIRRDTAANWTSVNPVLHQGEFGHETDTGKVKLGDGTTAWTSLAYLAAKQPATPKTFTPANPTGTVSSAAEVMMGLGAAGGGQACLYTPNSSGHVLVIITCTIWLTTGANNATVGARYGTGTAPANGAAVAGTMFGTGPADELVRPGGSTAGQGFTAQAVVSLTPGTQYWFDLAVQAPGSANTTTPENISVTLIELPV